MSCGCPIRVEPTLQGAVQSKPFFILDSARLDRDGLEYTETNRDVAMECESKSAMIRGAGRRKKRTGAGKKRRQSRDRVQANPRGLKG